MVRRCGQATWKRTPWPICIKNKNQNSIETSNLEPKRPKIVKAWTILLLLSESDRSIRVHPSALLCTYLLLVYRPKSPFPNAEWFFLETILKLPPMSCIHRAKHLYIYIHARIHTYIHT